MEALLPIVPVGNNYVQTVAATFAYTKTTIDLPYVFHGIYVRNFHDLNHHAEELSLLKKGRKKNIQSVNDKMFYKFFNV